MSTYNCNLKKNITNTNIVRYKTFFAVKDLADFINKDLNLIGRDIISSDNLQNWKKKELLSYRKEKGKIVINIEQYRNIKKIVFYHIVLGISLKKIKTTIEYFSKEFIKINEDI